MLNGGGEELFIEFCSVASYEYRMAACLKYVCCKLTEVIL